MTTPAILLWVTSGLPMPDAMASIVTISNRSAWPFYIPVVALCVGVFFSYCWHLARRTDKRLDATRGTSAKQRLDDAREDYNMGGRAR
jgi:hypothetical protein